MQSRHRLLRSQSARLSIVVKENHRRSFLLNRIQPLSIGMKCKMPWAISGGKRSKLSRPVRRQHSRRPVQSGYINAILSQVRIQNMPVIRRSQNHMRMRPIMPADGKAILGRIRSSLRSDWPAILMRISSSAKGSIRLDRQNSSAAIVIVSCQNILARVIDADICRPLAFGTYRIQERQIASLLVHRISSNRTALAMRARIGVNLIARVQILVRRMQRQARWTGGLGNKLDQRQFSGPDVPLVEINSVATTPVGYRTGISSHISKSRTRSRAAIWLMLRGKDRLSDDRSGRAQQKTTPGKEPVRDAC